MKVLLQAAPAPVSMIIGPNGDQLVDPVIGGEGTVLSEIDTARSIEHKMAHDIVGYYNRFDIFHLEFDPTPNRRICIRNSRSLDEQPPDESTHIWQEEMLSRIVNYERWAIKFYGECRGDQVSSLEGG
jgi:hypothetical protein